MLMVTDVPMKGASQEFLVRKLFAFLKELGAEASSIALKPDQEPAIVDLFGVVSKQGTAQTF